MYRSTPLSIRAIRKLRLSHIRQAEAPRLGDISFAGAFAVLGVPIICTALWWPIFSIGVMIYD